MSQIRLDRGRVVVHQPKSMEISGSGSGESWTLDRALVAVKIASLMKSQPEPCLACQWGALADVIDKRDREESRFRNLYCLKGVGSAVGCPVRVKKLLEHNKSSI